MEIPNPFLYSIALLCIGYSISFLFAKLSKMLKGNATTESAKITVSADNNVTTSSDESDWPSYEVNEEDSQEVQQLKLALNAKEYELYTIKRELETYFIQNAKKVNDFSDAYKQLFSSLEQSAHHFLGQQHFEQTLLQAYHQESSQPSEPAATSTDSLRKRLNRIIKPAFTRREQMADEGDSLEEQDVREDGAETIVSESVHTEQLRRTFLNQQNRPLHSNLGIRIRKDDE